MDFQTWFVRQQGQPEVARVECGHGGGVNPEVLSVIADCDLLLLAPSNPYLSVLPMLGVPEVARAVRARAGASWAVSPLLGGKAVKGPLDRLLQQLSPNHHGQQAIVELYSDWVQRLLLPADELKGLHSDRGLKLQPCRTRLSQARQRAEFVEDLMAAWKAAV
jgi:LPPG:FO 2-phospho-L-lactate transferase